MVTVIAFADWAYVMGLKITLPRTVLSRQKYGKAGNVVRKEKNQRLPESEVPRQGEIRH